jgi:hypothetical protein
MATVIKADDMIVEIIRTSIAQRADELERCGAEVRFSGASNHPLTNSCIFFLGMFMGRYRTLDSVYDFLGENGYIDTVTWRPYGDSRFIQLGVHHGGQAVTITNCFSRITSHYASLPGAKWMSRHTPDDEVRPGVTRRHIVSSRDELMALVQELMEY